MVCRLEEKFMLMFFHQHAYALELLFDQLHEGAKALDVGSGSGILTACFARMVRTLFSLVIPIEVYCVTYLWFLLTGGFNLFVCLLTFY